MRREKSLKDKIYSWFRNRGNVPATVKQVQEAFSDYAPSEVEKALDKRNSKGQFDFCIYDSVYRYCLYAKDFLYPKEAEAPKKEEKPEARTKKLTIKERIENWFKERGNKSATLKEVQKAFPDINPKSISGTLSGKDKRGRFNFNADYPKDLTSPTRYYSFLPIEEAVEEAVRLATCEGDCSHCEAETCNAEEEQEAGSASPEKILTTKFFSGSEAEIPSVATSLKSIAKSLAQIAEVETAIAKLFFEKQKG